MAVELSVRPIYQLGLDTSELLLICKALGGRLKEDEVDAAHQLGDRITEIRAGCLRAFDRTAFNLENALKAKGTPTDER